MMQSHFGFFVPLQGNRKLFPSDSHKKFAKRQEIPSNILKFPRSFNTKELMLKKVTQNLSIAFFHQVFTFSDSPSWLYLPFKLSSSTEECLCTINVPRVSREAQKHLRKGSSGNSALLRFLSLYLRENLSWLACALIAVLLEREHIMNNEIVNPVCQKVF